MTVVSLVASLSVLLGTAISSIFPTAQFHLGPMGQSVGAPPRTRSVAQPAASGVGDSPASQVVGTAVVSCIVHSSTGSLGTSLYASPLAATHRLILGPITAASTWRVL